MASSTDRWIPPTYLRNLRQLTIHDEEYHRIAYLLRSSLRSLSVKIVSIHAINSPQQDAAFESNFLGHVTLDSWINGRDLPEENSVLNIVHHGGRFRITDANKGAIFTTGNIEGLDPTQVPAGPQHYEFLHCRIATGRSFVVDPAQIGEQGIPAGYDSIAIHADRKEADGATPGAAADPDNTFALETHDYFYEYVLNDESKIYPDFVVNFVFDPNADRIKEVPNCEACDARPAVLFCLQDNAKLCEVCDRDMHSRSPIYQRHTRCLLHEMQNTVGLTMCPEHTNIPIQFYDPNTHVPLCIQCKMVGSHSTGENATHKLVSIQDAYQHSIDDMEHERLIVEERKKTILSQLSSIDKRMTAVNASYERVQDQIYDIVQRAVQVLQEETQSKLSALLSDESELRRQLEFYAKMDSFLRYQRSCMNPVEFLQVFRSHSTLLAQTPSEIQDSSAHVKPDIRVVGRLDVVVDDGSGVVAGTANNMGVAPPGTNFGRNPGGHTPGGPHMGASTRSAAGPQPAPIMKGPAAPRYAQSPSIDPHSRGGGVIPPGSEMRGNFNPYK